MFDDLKAQLAAVEAKLRAALDALQGRIAGLEGQIQTIEQPVLGAFDRFGAAADSVAGVVQQRIGAIRGQIDDLRR